MQKRIKSLLEELESIGSNRDINHVIESRANNMITSVINLVELIYKNYPKDKAELLEKRLLSSIKNKDPNKFTRTIRKKDAPQETIKIQK